jgi:predicted GNAT superfamily acetyltransferase
MGMSDLVTAPPGSPARRILDAADDAARAAAQASGVQIRELSDLGDLQRCCDLVDEIWHPQPGNEPVTAEILRALAHSGNYVAGAFLGDDMVGTSVGVFASPGARAMHSHLAGVSPRLPGKHVGFAVKLHQRAWALMRGVTAITWTFDPLVCRNAYFNIAKLAARPVEYLPDFYGAMNDDINSGDDSDRLLVQWPLTDDSVAAASQGIRSGVDTGGLRAAGAPVALDCDPSGFPVVHAHDGAPPVVLVGVPLDIEATRHDNQESAHQWRHAMRQVLGGLLADGGRVTGFDRSGWYVVQRGHTTGGAASNPDRKAPS